MKLKIAAKVTETREFALPVFMFFVLTVGIPESARSILMTFMDLLRAIGHLFGHGLPELSIG